MSKTWEDEAENWLRWARTPGHDAYRAYSSAFFEELVPAPAGRVLEIGCGEGRVSRDLVTRGHTVVGLDPSPTLVGHAKQADSEASYLIAGGEHLPFTSATFGLVVAYNSLQNVSDLPATVREAHRVLEPSGRFCICIPHPMSDAGSFESAEPDAAFVMRGTYYGPRRVDETEERAGLQITFHGWAYALEEYARALEQAGFLIEMLREPHPDDEALTRRPHLSQWQRLPLFLFLRAIKRPD